MRLELGDQLTWDDVTFELVALDASRARLRAVDEGYVRVALVADLLRDPSVEWPGAAKRRGMAVDGLLDQVPPEQRRAAEFWLPHVRRLDAHLATGGRESAATRTLVQEIVQAIGAQRASGTVDTRTVWRKLDAYREHGAVGLVYRSYRSPKRHTRDARLLEIVGEICWKANWESTGTIGRIIDDVRFAIADRYGDQPPFDVPSDRTMRRLIGEVPRSKHLTTSAKTRMSLANRPQREFRQHESPRLGEHVQIDTNSFDAEIMLDDGQVTTRGGMARPEMTILLEVSSRYPIAAVLRAGGTKSADLATVLARALTPYDRRPDGARQTRELVSAAWAEPRGITQEELDRYRNQLPFVFPETITTDNGKIYTSKAFREACERLGISLIFSAPYTPTGKPHIERLFGTIADQFAQYLRSYVGRSAEHRGKDEAPHSAPTLIQAQELLDDWIAVHWMHRPHDGLRDPLRPRRKLTPMEMATLMREISPELPIPFGYDEYVGLLPAETRKMQAYGFNIRYRRYTSARLSELVGTVPGALQKSWTIRRDPLNIYTVWLDLGDEFVPLNWAAGAAEMPFRDEVVRALRENDLPRSESPSRAGQALKEGLRRGRYGDPAAARKASQTRAALDDPMALARYVEPEEPAAKNEKVGPSDTRFRRTGGNGFLEAGADRAVWDEAGGFQSTKDVKARLDD
ncbi:hypothetical protein D8Y23_13995 [Microbacterium enclense]|uniref:Integrase catalytic domain-containing protein n=1 Tax=Microbacterium enclense TaxID=993073 RepID=A0A443J703_9MICO|nr:Mu transposase C-terminal domain-containing protein [Microbacterium enclense]RWR16193.1 hypothetical protein D8Y23_13995 [Microbacterium enclense]